MKLTAALGIKAGGVDDAKPLPLQWGANGPKLVKWRVAVEGLGHSSPVAWGEMIFRTRNHLLSIGGR